MEVDTAIFPLDDEAEEAVIQPKTDFDQIVWTSVVQNEPQSAVTTRQVTLY